MRSKEIEAALKFDPLDFAERVTGDRSKSLDGPGTLLGMALHMEHGQRKNALLKASGDTTLSNRLADYQRIIEGAGFEKVFEEQFESRCDWNEDGFDTYYIYARRDGFLLGFDTYYQSTDEVETSVNGGHLWYNWIPNEGVERWGLSSSGGMTDGVWVGNHDCREALLHNIQGLLENGTVLSPWKHQPSAMWFMGYGDWRHPDYKDKSYREGRDFIDEMTARRAAQLPDWVKMMIGFTTAHPST